MARTKFNPVRQINQHPGDNSRNAYNEGSEISREWDTSKTLTENMKRVQMQLERLWPSDRAIKDAIRAQYSPWNRVGLFSRVKGLSPIRERNGNQSRDFADTPAPVSHDEILNFPPDDVKGSTAKCGSWTDGKPASSISGTPQPSSSKLDRRALKRKRSAELNKLRCESSKPRIVKAPKKSKQNSGYLGCSKKPSETSQRMRCVLREWMAKEHALGWDKRSSKARIRSSQALIVN